MAENKIGVLGMKNFSFVEEQEYAAVVQPNSVYKSQSSNFMTTGNTTVSQGGMAFVSEKRREPFLKKGGGGCIGNILGGVQIIVNDKQSRNEKLPDAAMFYQEGEQVKAEIRGQLEQNKKVATNIVEGVMLYAFDEK